MMDDFVIQYCRDVKSKDFVFKDEGFSSNKKGKRQYLTNTKTRQLINRLNAHFVAKVEVPRIRMGEWQEIETLISEEALLFGKYLRGEKPTWVPRIVTLS
jgi:hypothetical protein